MTNQQDELDGILMPLHSTESGAACLYNPKGRWPTPCGCGVKDAKPAIEALISQRVLEALEKVEQEGPKDVKLPRPDAFMHGTHWSNNEWRKALTKIKEEYGGNHGGSETS